MPGATRHRARDQRRHSGPNGLRAGGTSATKRQAGQLEDTGRRRARARAGRGLPLPLAVNRARLLDQEAASGISLPVSSPTSKLSGCWGCGSAAGAADPRRPRHRNSAAWDSPTRSHGTVCMRAQVSTSSSLFIMMPITGGCPRGLRRLGRPMARACRAPKKQPSVREMMPCTSGSHGLEERPRFAVRSSGQVSVGLGRKFPPHSDLRGPQLPLYL